MLQIRVAVSLSSLHYRLKDALQIAAEIGAEAVVIDARNQMKASEMGETAIRHFRKLLSDLNLKVAALTFQTRGSYYELHGLEQRVQATKDVLKFAYALGASVVVNQIGKVPEDKESEHYNTLLQTLSDIGRESQKAGAFLAARTGTEAGTTLAELIKDLPTGSLVVDFDPGNLIINGFSASEAIGVLAKDTIHVHARDGVQDLAQGRGIEVELGRGSADFPNILGKLEEFQYRGYLTVHRDNSKDPVVEAQQAIEFLRNLG